jgi:Na+/proline symporter
MRFGVALQSEDAVDRKRLFLSLGGAVLLASLGFVLIFLLFAWLPYLAMSMRLPEFFSHFPRMFLALMPTWGLAAGIAGVLLGLLAARVLRPGRKHFIRLV